MKDLYYVHKPTKPGSFTTVTWRGGRVACGRTVAPVMSFCVFWRARSVSMGTLVCSSAWLFSLLGFRFTMKLHWFLVFCEIVFYLI